MPPRKYPDLAHLSTEDYRKEAEKRRGTERNEYRRELYQKHRESILLDSKNKRITERIEKTKKKLQELEEKKASVAAEQ